MYRYCLPSALVVLGALAGAGRAGESAAVRIGIPRCVFPEVPTALLPFANQPFKDLLKTQTGIDCEVENDDDGMKVARDIDAGKTQLGVFLGHEFAWARQKFPDLEPIVVAVQKPREVKAFILVRHDSKAATLADLKAAKLVVPGGTREHSRLFLAKRRADDMAGGPVSPVGKADTVQDAINKVIDGDADFTVTDQGSWAYFQRIYPGRAQNLKVLAESEVFPQTVVAYHKGSLTDAVVKKFRDGLLTAHESAQGLKSMVKIRVEKFAPVPATYFTTLADIMKVYPAPAGK